MPESAGSYYFTHEAKDHNPKRPPIILIHGAGGNYLSWPAQIRRLAGERMYAPDLPGHGQSEGESRRSIHEYAGHVIAFMESLNICAAVLAGISMGSAIALALAVEYPKKVLGLVLLGGGAKMYVAPKILEMAGDSNRFESVAEMLHENFFSAHAPSKTIRRSKQNMMKIRPSVLFGDFLACSKFDVTDQLKNINVPALIICGAEDRMMPPKNSESLREGIPNSRIHFVDRAGHMVMLEQPEVVANLLKQFMDDLPPCATP